MQHSIQFGSKKIEFTVNYSNRKTLGIAITPELQVQVTAPHGSSIDKIKEKIRKRAPWIIRQEQFFLSFEPRTPHKIFANGESHLFLGKSFRLKLNIDIKKKESVHYHGHILDVTVRKKSNTEKLIKQWYRVQAANKFAEFALPIIGNFKSYNAKPKGIYLLHMPTRWGSCTPKGKIILNPELVKAPKRCIEYVIIHELCHLVHRDHTQKFFALQKKMMPDWVKWKEKLEREMA